jgi:hypothetical protein
MRGETTVPIIAGHELTATDGGASRPAGWTHSTGDHCGNDNGSSQPAADFLACGDDPPGDFVAQDEGKGVARRNPIERKSDVGVANATAGDLHNQLIGAGLQRRQLARLQGSAWGS